MWSAGTVCFVSESKGFSQIGLSLFHQNTPTFLLILDQVSHHFVLRNDTSVRKTEYLDVSFYFFFFLILLFFILSTFSWNCFIQSVQPGQFLEIKVTPKSRTGTSGQKETEASAKRFGLSLTHGQFSQSFLEIQSIIEKSDGLNRPNWFNQPTGFQLVPNCCSQQVKRHRLREMSGRAVRDPDVRRKWFDQIRDVMMPNPIMEIPNKETSQK